MSSTNEFPSNFPRSIFFIVPAKSRDHIFQKIMELERLGVPFVIVCGEHIDHPHVVYRPAKGKYDALNYGVSFIPDDAKIIAFNDVDTTICNFQSLFPFTQQQDFGIVFTCVKVVQGPQQLFYKLLDGLRKQLLIAASGELMLLQRDMIQQLFPIPACKAEDSYLLFKAIELGYPAQFITYCSTLTERPITLEREEQYKRRTVAGIYQALSYTNPPIFIKVFYFLLPLFSPLLMVMGKTGYHWMRGIQLGFLDNRRGDFRGYW